MPSRRPDPPSRPGQVGTTPTRFGAGFWIGVEGAVLLLLKTPEFLRFPSHAFGDLGIDSAVRSMLDRGYRPTLDFGYIYGLLPLLVGGLLRFLGGLTPLGSCSAIVATNLLMVWGLVRAARALRVGPAGWWLLAGSLPHLLHCRTTLGHAIEPVLLAHALAEQASGRRRSALAMVTLCLFVKPAMAYPYGLILAIAMLARCRAAGLARAFGPAAVTGLAVAALLAGVYGVEPVARSLFPLDGARAYRAGHFGFFRGIGRDFWAPPSPTAGYYLGTAVGVWLLGTVVLAVGAVAVIRRAASDRTLSDRGEVILTCAALHAAFVACFYGNLWSWGYYVAIPVVGLLGLSAGRKSTGLNRLDLIPAVLLVLSWRSYYGAVTSSWKTLRPSAVTAGLYADASERDEWATVRELTRGRTVALVSYVEGAAVIFPGFLPPETTALVRGHVRPAELARKVGQVATARMIVFASFAGEAFDRWPEFAGALEGCELAWSGRHFRVYRRAGADSIADRSRMPL